MHGVVSTFFREGCTCSYSMARSTHAAHPTEGPQWRTFGLYGYNFRVSLGCSIPRLGGSYRVVARRQIRSGFLPLEQTKKRL